MSSFTWPPIGFGGGVAVYSTFSAFPAGTTVGQLGLAADTGIFYEWNGSAWIAIAGPGVALSLAAFGSTPNANGLTLTSNALNMEPADGSHPGGVSITTQTFAGQKTFSTGLTGTLTGAASLNVLTSALGNLTDAGTDGITVGTGTGAVVGNVTLSQHVSDASHNGYLSSADWTTFNGKQPTITIGALDAQVANATGLALVSNVLSTQSADATHPGLVNNTTQTLSGAKTFSGLTTHTGGITSAPAGSGARNEVYGSGAGAALTVGTDNTFVGFNAGTAVTTATTNVAIGTSALSSLTVAHSDGNTAVGYQALKNQTTSAGFNTALGYQAGAAITSGNTNTAFGYQTLNTLTGGSGNTAVGQGAFTGTTTVGNSVGVGVSAGFQTTATNATYIGANSGQQASGNSQVGIGLNSMRSATGAMSIGLGQESGHSSTGAHTLYIGDTTQDATAYAINTVVIASSNATGAVWTQNQNFSGTVNMSALTLSTGLQLDASKNIVSATLGTVTEATSSVLTLTGFSNATFGSPTIQVKQSSTSVSGYLSNTDWNTFNGKQAAGSYITALTGDVTASGPGSVAATLAATSNATLTTLSGLTTAASLATVGTITSGTWNGTTVAVNHGGTGLATLTTGNVILGAGTSTPTFVAPSTSGNVLTSNGSTWVSSASTGPNFNSELWVSGASNASGGNDSVSYATTQISTGSNITYTRDTVNGDKFLFPNGGVFACSGSVSGTQSAGFTLNIYATGGIRALTAAQVVAISGGDSASGADSFFSVTMRFAANDYITVGTQLAGIGPDGTINSVHITQVGN